MNRLHVQAAAGRRTATDVRIQTAAGQRTVSEVWYQTTASRRDLIWRRSLTLDDLTGTHHWQIIRNTIALNPNLRYNTNGIVTFGNFGTTARKWAGGVLHPNGLIYGIPFNDNRILVIDPNTNTATTWGNLGTPTLRYHGGVLHPNGRIYGIPYSRQTMLIIDPVAGTVRETGNHGGASGTHAFFVGGVLGTDGHIYCVPFDRAVNHN
jgi:DNA-binding beta-propeller fold protein YncE